MTPFWPEPVNRFHLTFKNVQPPLFGCGLYGKNDSGPVRRNGERIVLPRGCRTPRPTIRFPPIVRFTVRLIVVAACDSHARRDATARSHRPFQRR